MYTYMYNTKLNIKVPIYYTYKLIKHEAGST